MTVRTTLLGPVAIGIGIGMVLVALAIAGSAPDRGPGPEVAGIRCHWRGPYLVARGSVVNFGDRETTIVVRPDIAVVGAGGLAHESDAVFVGAAAAGEWRWTTRPPGIPPGSAVTRCAATASYGGGTDED